MGWLSRAEFWNAFFVVVLVLFAVLVIKTYMKKLSQGCCGGGDAQKEKKIRVRDRDKSHYPFIAVLTIDGMVCGNCARRIENALNVLDGVWAVADVSAKEVTVYMKQSLDDGLLRETVNQIGPYTVMKVTRDRR